MLGFVPHPNLPGFCGEWQKYGYTHGNVNCPDDPDASQDTLFPARSAGPRRPAREQSAAGLLRPGRLSLLSRAAPGGVAGARLPRPRLLPDDQPHPPAHYPWSSYRANALGEADDFLSHHPLYQSLGATAPERLTVYRELIEQALDPATVKEIRACLQTGTPLGNDRFRDEIERALGVKVGYASRGRPRKVRDEMGPLGGQMPLGI